MSFGKKIKSGNISNIDKVVKHTQIFIWSISLNKPSSVGKMVQTGGFLYGSRKYKQSKKNVYENKNQAMQYFGFRLMSDLNLHSTS